MTLDSEFRQLSRVQTSLVGWGGREYQLIGTPHGHLIVGYGGEPYPRTNPPKSVLAEYAVSGTLLWQQSITAQMPPLLAPFPSGFYLVRELFGRSGVDVEKFVY